MNEGERQVAPTLDGIRRDHVARYEWAAKRTNGYVIDVACGIGYGSKILAEAGCHVLAVDKDAEALAYGERHYPHERVNRCDLDVSVDAWRLPATAQAAVCFETVEHIADPLPLLKGLREAAPVLFASVPNEAEFPWLNYAFHFRHYTQGQFEALLNEAGWEVVEWHGQAGDESEVEPGAKGRTLIAVCKRGEIKTQKPGPQAAAPKPEGIGHVAILGLGPSVRQYLELVKRLGSKRALCDETWGINAIGDVINCDRVIHMDDVRVQEIRAAAQPKSNIANMLGWLKRHPGPIVTSIAHPDYPGTVEFPLAEVLNICPNGYFNSTAAYAVAYAIHQGARKISVWGADFTYPDAHDAEKGRACVEFWLGVASARGIEIAVPRTTTLLDAMYPMAGVERFYGYDCADLAFGRDAAGKVTVNRTPKAELPTADEIEHRYSHARHPNALVEEGQSD